MAARPTDNSLTILLSPRTVKTFFTRNLRRPTDVSAFSPLYFCFIGRKHAYLNDSGFTADIWEHFGETALDIFIMQDCVKSSQDAIRAWSTVFACMTDSMRCGFEDECRDIRRKKDRRRLSAEVSGRRNSVSEMPNTIDQSETTQFCSRPSTLTVDYGKQRKKSKSAEIPILFNFDGVNMEQFNSVMFKKCVSRTASGTKVSRSKADAIRLGADLHVGVSPTEETNQKPFGSRNAVANSNEYFIGLRNFVENISNFPKCSCANCGQPIKFPEDLRLQFSSAKYLEKISPEDLKLDSLEPKLKIVTRAPHSGRRRRLGNFDIPEILIHLPDDDSEFDRKKSQASAISENDKTKSKLRNLQTVLKCRLM